MKQVILVLKRIGHVINILVWTLIGAYLVVTVLLNIPAVKRVVAEKASVMLSEKLGTEVNIGKVDISLFNRVIIDGIDIKDQSGKDLLKAPRMSVGWSLIDMMKGQISISSAQIFGMKADFYRKTATAKTNFQFIIDSLSSKEKKEPSKINLKISSLIIRRSQIAYNELDAPYGGIISPKHVNLKDISAHFILNKLTNDSIDMAVKKLAFKDKSGLEVKRFTAKFVGGKSGMLLSDFHLSLPHSALSIPEAVASYSLEDGKIKAKSLKYSLALKDSYVTLHDLSCLTSKLTGNTPPIYLSADIDGTDTRVRLKSLSVKQTPGLTLSGNALLHKEEGIWNWDCTLENLHTNAEGIRSLASNIGKEDAIPAIIDNLGEITISGKTTGNAANISVDSRINTGIGSADIKLDKHGNSFISDLKASNLDLATLTGKEDFGNLDGVIHINGNLSGSKLASCNVVSNIEKIAYKNHTYHNADIKADYTNGGQTAFALHLNDEYAMLSANGSIDLTASKPKTEFTVKASNVCPSRLGLTDKWKDNTFDFTLDGNIHGNNINNAEGSVALHDFSMYSEDDVYRLNNLEVQKYSHDGNEQRIVMRSDFANMSVDGKFDYNTLYNSLIATISNRLPTMPGLPKVKKAGNRINLYGTVYRTDWAEKLLGVPLQLGEEAHIIANIDDNADKANVNIDIPDFTYNGKRYRDGYLIMTSPNDTLKAKVNITAIGKRGNTSHYLLNANAVDNHLVSQATFNINGRNIINGKLNTDTRFYKNSDGLATAHVNIKKSEILIDDTVWTVSPSEIEFHKNRLAVNGLSVKHDRQEITIDGKNTTNPEDEIKVRLKDVNVAYILDLVNFHSVDFAGHASGEASLCSLFDNPSAKADISVKNFLFENGNLGTLYAKADWNLEEGDINIDAHAEEDGECKTVVGGFVSPKRNCIGLNIKAYGASLEFLNTYCDSFADNLDLRGWGTLNVVGPFSAIQLIGDASAKGSARITSLNTTYNIDGARVKFNPDDIIFYNDTIRDRVGNIGVVNGHLRHKHLGQFTYDLSIAANNLLSYDTHEFGNDVFYGTAYATGTCDIHGKSGEVTINIEATPEKNSQIVYNAASQDAIANSEFITWNDRNQEQNDESDADDDEQKKRTNQVGTNMYLNMLVHCNPNATMKVLMDQQSGDYIALTGSGAIRTSYYNKGGFDMFGNYTVDHGVYKLTIQNVIKRDFDFQSGGTISFGGDAYNATLDLKALYTLNSVPLSDISLGSSFFNNNIRVDCIMNISGTPGQPHVDFSLDMPTVSNDAKQMVMSVMNSNEEINQQVLYLLAVGRFLNQNNNATAQSQRQSQTSLAMQSIISGTISQQLSTVLENVVGSNQWNLGANISTGDEGFNNAEYEGLVSGRLLDNRLLINGQFGYRDNQNATSTFIGDFDIRYLLVPSGSAAIRVYNQTNDKYFTKNSLNTQGVGLIFKKDFNGWRDFFRWSRRNKR